MSFIFKLLLIYLLRSNRYEIGILFLNIFLNLEKWGIDDILIVNFFI